jgi:hypothetical protein
MRFRQDQILDGAHTLQDPRPENRRRRDGIKRAAYNITRVMNIMGIPAMIATTKAQPSAFALQFAPKLPDPSQVATIGRTIHLVRRNDDLRSKRAPMSKPTVGIRPR